MSFVRSKQRVADHGEVFTPARMVEAMLDLVKDESERIDSRFLEPACGSGNFLVPVLRRKLATVERPLRQERLREAPPRALGADVASMASSCSPTTSPSAARTCWRSSPTTSASSAGDEWYARGRQRPGRQHRARRRAVDDDARRRTRSRSPSPSGPMSARARTTAATSASTR